MELRECVMNKNLSFLWFLLGLCSELQVLFSLSILEIMVLVCGPVLAVSEISHMRRTGIMSFFWIFYKKN